MRETSAFSCLQLWRWFYLIRPSRQTSGAAFWGVGVFRGVSQSLAQSDGGARADDGFAAIDALVALTIISTTIILSLGAVETGRRAAVAGAETRRAGDLMQYLLGAAPMRPGSASGEANGFVWRVDTEAEAASALPSLRLCDRWARLVSRASGRRYAMRTAAICAVRDAS
jgi:hypothetical protein